MQSLNRNIYERKRRKPSDSDNAHSDVNSGSDATVSQNQDDRRRSGRTSATLKQRNQKVQRQKARPIRDADSPNWSGWFQDIGHDLMRVLRIFWRLRWLFYAYVIWMLLSWTAVFLVEKTGQALEPICRTPIIGEKIPFCAGSIETELKTPDVTNIALPQQELSDVMSSVGQNFQLARGMISHEYAVRDLKIRVGASDLRRKHELTEQLAMLIDRTDEASKGLSRFYAKTGKAVDKIIAFDRYMTRDIEALEGLQNNQYSLRALAVNALNPLGALKHATPDRVERDLKETFLKTSTGISNNIQPLIEDAAALDTLLSIIQTILDQIHALAKEEERDLPHMQTLASFWARLARADDFAQYKSHEGLLLDMVQFYERAGVVMRETKAALGRIDAELKEFRDEYATPGLVLRDFEIGLSVAMLRDATGRLEGGRAEMNRVRIGPPR